MKKKRNLRKTEIKKGDEKLKTKEYERIRSKV